jgi:hypothetical protein
VIEPVTLLCCCVRHCYCCSLPERYILVPKPADVLIRYILVYSDDAMLGLSHGSNGSRRHRGAATCLALTLAYAVAMLLLAAWQTHKSWR